MILPAQKPEPERSYGRSLKIDIVVPGRFHAFHLARALLGRGHDVRLLTNYPGWAVRRFGVASEHVRPFTLHGIATRVRSRTGGRFESYFGEPALLRMFGAWAARTVRRDADLVYVFSGVAEELLNDRRGARRPAIWVVRGSSHIRTQYALLADEEVRVGAVIEKPAAWTIEREEREYAAADRIVTLSTFSYLSFLEHGVGADRALLLLSAVDASRFRPTDEAVAARVRRIERGEPLRILTVGTFSFRKGAADLVAVAEAFEDRMQFRFVGDTTTETAPLLPRARRVIDMRPRVMEFDLVEHYKWADLFLFPTIEDGFPAVVAQAQASGLATITTPNGSGPDLVRENETGWIVPIRAPGAIGDRLNFTDWHRSEVAAMARTAPAAFKPRDWSAMAADLEAAFAAGETAATGRDG